MDIDAARVELARALATPTDRNGAGFRAARALLIDRGAEALGVPRSAVGSLDDVVRMAAPAPPTLASRAFAVLLVHALQFDGLLPARGESETQLYSFLERTLLNPLRRAGYPFDGTTYDKRRFLAGLHVTIDEHLRPLEPSIPRWIHGIGPAGQN